MNYLRGSKIERKYVVYSVHDDAYVQLLQDPKTDAEELYKFVEDVNEATFANSLEEVSSDLSYADIEINENIKILLVSITLDAIANFEEDFSSQVKRGDFNTTGNEQDDVDAIIDRLRESMEKKEAAKAKKAMSMSTVKNRQNPTTPGTVGGYRYDPTNIEENEFI